MTRYHDEEQSSLTKEALELLRTRELYKYYEPTTSPTDYDPGPDEEDYAQEASIADNISSDDEDVSDGRPLSTSDPVLASLVLLAERLLAADRVIVVFVDANREYLVADSGQALSHFTGKTKSHEVTPKTGSSKRRCQERRDLFSVFIDPPNLEPHTVIDDDLPVSDKWRKEWPEIRRYTGVPIQTRSGSIVGVLCALYKDVQPVSEEIDYDKTFTKLMATVMRYMEIVRGERDMRRGRKMEIALSRFIAGNHSPDKVALTEPPEGSIRVETSNQESQRMDSERAKLTRQRSEKEVELWSERQAKRNISIATSPRSDDSEGISPSTPSVNDSSGAASSMTGPTSYFDSWESSRQRTPSPKSIFPGHYGPAFKAPDRSPPPRNKRPSKEDQSESFNPSFLSRKQTKPIFLPGRKGTEPPPMPQIHRNSNAGSEVGSVNSLPVNVAEAHHELFTRASDLMRRAMEVDGVVFVNYDLEGLSDIGVPADGETSPIAHISSKSEMNEVIRATREHEAKVKSGILGISGANIAARKGSNKSSIMDPMAVDASQLSEGYLHTLCESWPRGCIFSYSRDPQDPVLGISVNPEIDSDLDGTLHDSINNIEIVDVLRQFLPGSKTVMFMPLYDFVGKVFAVGFAWRSSAVRVFRGDVEGGFMAAFCDSIMQEISRIHVVSANVAKGNFISTISHELRSPLHGILATCELFRENGLTEQQKDLVGTITSCGRTLLDTVNNVLTFTKLNTKAISRKDQVQKRNSIVSNVSPSPDETDKRIPEAPVMDVDLAELAEEVVESAYVGYRFDPSILQRKQLLDDETPDKALVLAKAHVYVTLDVDPEIAARRFAIPPGAFRRLMLNLCTNALKYTDHGWIRLELAMDPEDKRKVKLTVADSGRGISREFLKNSLFTPFMQEHPMQSGTGLGMSIVRQLVDELGGTIDVKSQVGVGTSVVIHLQLESTLPAVSDVGAVIPGDVFLTAQQVLKGKSACLVGIAHDSRSSATKDAITGLDTYLRQVLVKTFGMIILGGTLDALKGDIAIVQGGHDLDRYLETTTPSVPIVELGGSRSIRDTPNESVVYLSRPYCPRKLAAALLSAIRHMPLPVPKKAPSPINTAPSSPPKSTSPTPSSGRQSPKTTDEAQEKEFKPTLLIVDDNIVNLRIISTYCIKHGLSVVQATDGLEAVQAFKARQDGFDVVLMDLQMPVMSGMDAVRGIRFLEEKRGNQRAFVVAMTALSGDEVRREAKKAGCDEFLVKPVRMRKVVEIVEGWVARNAAAAAPAASTLSETLMEKQEHEEDAKMRAEELGKASAGNVVWESGNSTGSRADKGKENGITAATTRPSASTTATPTATSGRANQASGNQQTSDHPQNSRLTAILNTTNNAANSKDNREARRKSA